jgi:hypothetical protein
MDDLVQLHLGVGYHRVAVTVSSPLGMSPIGV